MPLPDGTAHEQKMEMEFRWSLGLQITFHSRFDSNPSAPEDKTAFAFRINARRRKLFVFEFGLNDEVLFEDIHTCI